MRSLIFKYMPTGILFQELLPEISKTFIYSYLSSKTVALTTWPQWQTQMQQLKLEYLTYIIYKTVVGWLTNQFIGILIVLSLHQAFAIW